MKRPQVFALTLVFSAMTLMVLAFAGDRSCTAVEQMVLQRRLDTAQTSGSMTEQQVKQFRQAAGALDQERKQVYQQSADNEKKYQDMMNKQREHIFTDNPELARKLMQEVMEHHKDLGNKAAQAVSEENPELVRQARAGDQQAKQKLIDLVNRRVLDDPGFVNDSYRAEQHSPEFQTRLQESLHKSPEFQVAAAREINDNARLTEIEARQQALAKQTTPAGYDRAVANTAQEIGQHYVSDNKEYGQLLARSQAAQDLLTTHAGSQGAFKNATENTLSTALVGRRFDTYEPPVAQALVDARSFNSEKQGAAIGAQLVLTHIVDQEKSTTARAVLMKDPPNQLSRSVAENTGKALIQLNDPYVAKSIYKEVPPPPPPKDPTPEGMQRWNREMARKLQIATEKAKAWTIEVIKLPSLGIQGSPNSAPELNKKSDSETHP